VVVAEIIEVAIGVVAVILGVLAIVFRVRYAAWQNRISKPAVGQEVTPRLAITTGAILIVAGIVLFGVALIHGVG